MFDIEKHMRDVEIMFGASTDPSPCIMYGLNPSTCSLWPIANTVCR
jgi:hypothetical protein